MIDTLLKIFFPIILGYILIKLKYLNSSMAKDLKLFVIRAAVPALVFTAMYTTDLETLKQLLPVASSYVVLTAILIILSFIILIGVKDNRLKAIYIIAIVWGNYGWMGWAVLNEALGPEGFYRGVFFTALWWPFYYLGAFIIAKVTKIEGHLDVKNYVVNMIIPTAALLFGVLFNLLGISIPEPIAYTFQKLGDMTVTIILFSVGLSISIGDTVKYFKISVVPTLLRPILGFCISILVVKLLKISDPISRDAIILASSMPVAIFSVVIAEMLGLDEKLMSAIFVLSTLFSLVTIPIVLFFL